MSEIHKKLMLIQAKLDAPKSQVNSFGNYKYRSCEDILAAVKPLLEETETTLTLNDEIVVVGTRVYVKATASLCFGEQCVHTTAYAREAENKKGMDESQITGAASSYARKYALNGLFCIDDTKDADTTNNGTGSPKIDDKSLHALRDGCLAKEIKEDDLCKLLNVEKLEDLLQSDFGKAVNVIKSKGKKNGNS